MRQHSSPLASSDVNDDGLFSNNSFSLSPPFPRSVPPPRPSQNVELPDSFTEELKDLLEGLLQRDVSKRLGCQGQGYVTHSTSSHQPHQRFTSTGVLTELITRTRFASFPHCGGGQGRNAGRLCLYARIVTDITWSIRSRGSWLVSPVPSFHISLWLKLSDGSLSAEGACLNNTDVTRESCGKYCHLVDNVETQIKTHPSPSFLPPLCHKHPQSPRGEGAPVFQRHWLAAGVPAEGEEASFVLCAAGLKKRHLVFFVNMLCYDGSRGRNHF